MSTLLSPGDVLEGMTGGARVRVGTFLGGGGQGEVYEAETDHIPLAVKWYFPHCATRRQRQALQRLVEAGPPDNRFLWPLDLATSRTRGDFGYLMPLRPTRFRGLVDLMNGSASPSFRALTRTGLELADSFLQLHAAGSCYRDISFGNVFFDPLTGEVLVCDNDNVGVDDGTTAAISGTVGFMAPEVMRGEVGPSAATDLYSLAVLLFYMFMLHHPLHGQREAEQPVLDGAALQSLYALDPLFVFDPDDTSNGPVPGSHDTLLTYWPLYPQWLHKLFVRAFTVGLRDPAERVRESEWRLAMLRLHDAVVLCDGCSEEVFWDEHSATDPVCWSCGRAVTLPPRLVLEGRTLMLNHDTKLYAHHVGDRRFDLATVVAAVTRHPQQPRLWGLRNLSSRHWVAVTATGDVADLAPGRSVTLAPGTRVHFGTVDGVIVC